MTSSAPLLANRPNHLLWRLVGGLLLLNLALVGWLCLAPTLAARPRPTAASSGATFLADTLQFSATQRVRYDSLRARYFRQVAPLAQQCRQSCQQYFSLLDSSLTDAQLAQRSREALDGKVAVDVLTVRHLQQVAALCTPTQRILLQRLVSQAPGSGCAAPGANAECLMPLNQ